MKNVHSETPLPSPLLQLPGATALPADEQLQAPDTVAWHYGEPLNEQRSFHLGCALVDRSHRTVLAVRGEDAAPFLNNLLSQKLIDAPTGFAAQALDLDAQGRILHLMDVLLWEDTFYLDCEPEAAASLEQYLSRMVFWSKVEITRTDLCVLTLAGQLPELEGAYPHRVLNTLEVPRMDVLVPRDEALGVARALIAQGARPAGLMAYTAERVRALAPELADLDEKSIPHESTSLIAHAVHLNKGCYRGQETVARVENLGRSPRVLVLVHLDGSAPTLPVPGDAITAGRAVGRVGTVVHDYEYGPIALALVKRTAVQREDLSVGDVALSVDPDTIPKEAGTPVGRQAIERLQGRNSPA